VLGGAGGEDRAHLPDEGGRVGLAMGRREHLGGHRFRHALDVDGGASHFAGTFGHGLGHLLDVTVVAVIDEEDLGDVLPWWADLPPLMFSAQEAQSLVACVRMAQAWQDPALAQAAQVALGKVLSVLPPAARAAAQAMAVFAPPIGLEPAVQDALAGLRSAAHQRERVLLAYQDAGQQVSRRTVRPLACFFWGKEWTLAA